MSIASNWRKNASIKIMLSKKFLFLITLVCSHVFVNGQSTIEEYGIVMQDERITLYERWVFFLDTNIKGREIQGVFETSASMAKMLTTVVDETRIREWQTNIIKYQYIPGSDSIWHTYALYKMPWPLNKQDYLLKYTLRKLTDNLTVLSFQDSLDEQLAPVIKNVDRKPTVGYWQFEKLSNGKTKVVYTIVTKPTGYPRFITDPIVRNNLMSIINALVEVAEK
jgi:hypothetical protein